jgi:hypothetical protein
MFAEEEEYFPNIFEKLNLKKENKNLINRNQFLFFFTDTCSFFFTICH